MQIVIPTPLAITVGKYLFCGLFGLFVMRGIGRFFHNRSLRKQLAKEQAEVAEKLASEQAVDKKQKEAEQQRERLPALWYELYLACKDAYYCKAQWNLIKNFCKNHKPQECPLPGMGAKDIIDIFDGHSHRKKAIQRVIMPFVLAHVEKG